MAIQTFYYYPNVFGDAFPDAQAYLTGSWNATGHFTQNWMSLPMKKVPSQEGGYRYEAQIKLDFSQTGQTFYWGVWFEQAGQRTWAIATEVNQSDSRARHRCFVFKGEPEQHTYYLTYCRYLGAGKRRKSDGTWATQFRVWAPNAQKVELAFGSRWNLDEAEASPLDPETPLLREKTGGGYIDDEGQGIHPDLPIISMNRQNDGIWETPEDHPALQDLKYLNQRLYMYRLTQEDGSTVFRTDLYSRCQIGYGAINPAKEPFSGALADLSGGVSCSVSLDLEKVSRSFEVPVWPIPPEEFIEAEDFWADEFAERPLPQKVEDLIIYELHLGALGPGHEGPGTLKEAMEMLDYIEALHVNAIELLPISEFSGDAFNWGYATSHYFAIEYSGGGRDQFKHFVKACHQRGIAVILDMVYNHYDHSASRAQRYFDSPKPENDIYYWYEGKADDYRYLEEEGWGENWYRGGYLDNLSTGDTPAYHEEMVRKLFISSAVSMIQDFHVDGFRIDQTTSIHQYNRVRATGKEASQANLFGAKFLRELGKTLRMFKPDIILTAEDHSDWEEVTRPVEDGGMGFDARWYSGYYHSLIGDTDRPHEANLIREASIRSSNSPLAMAKFAEKLWNTQYQKVVYSESHDEAGNSSGLFPDPNWTDQGKEETSHRTIVVAVNQAPMIGLTRKYAEARSRFAWGITVLSAGTPMIFFGDEVGAEKRFKYNTVTEYKEDLPKMRESTGRFLYQFYAEINALRRQNSGLRSRNIDIVYVSDSNRLIVYKRWDSTQTFLVIASLADKPYEHGYTIYSPRLEKGVWQEVFNSDAAQFGGEDVGNTGVEIESRDGLINLRIPFAGLVVLQRI